MAAKYIAGLRAVLAKKFLNILAVALMATTVAVFLVRFRPNSSIPGIDISHLPGIPTLTGSHKALGSCGAGNSTQSLKRWRAARKKYDKLTDDKFTIVIMSYKRPKELDDTLRALLTEKIPSLHEIVIVWNDLEEVPPDNFESENGIAVRYRKSSQNSLNEKLRPDPHFETRAVLLSDDDVYYKPQDLEFVFQTWRKFGQHRLTGALPRCAVPSADGKWKYTFCSQDPEEDAYSMIITNLCFSNMAFLDYYHSDDPVMRKIRKYVDDHMNCEDIAMNFVASYLTGTGPLLVLGREQFVNSYPVDAISNRPGHLNARSKCLNDFSQLFGCMPLHDETARIGRGVVLP